MKFLRERNMLRRVITVVIVALGGNAIVMAAGGDRFESFDPTVALPHFSMRDETARDALIRLGDAQGFYVCIEGPKNGDLGFSTRRSSMEFSDSSIESIVEAILDRDGGYSWNMDGNVLNVVSKELMASNPFESKVEGFRFEGTADEFLEKASSLVPGLSVSRVRYYLPEEPVFEFEIPGPVLLREAFNYFTRTSRMRWQAKVPEAPTTLTITSGDEPIDIGALLFVNVQFSYVHPNDPAR